MNKNIFLCTFCFFGLLTTTLIQAADHLDAPLVMTDGRLDINDSFIFQAPNNPQQAVLLMTVNPAAGVFSPTTFNPAGVYEFNIDNNGDAIPDITLAVRFGVPNGSGNQRFTLRINNALISRGSTGKNARLRVNGGGTIRCGLFDDPFFFDLAGFMNGDFTGDDFFAGLNVSAIVIQLPTSLLIGPTTVGANVSLSCRTTINGQQFDRLGRPAINTVLIPNDKLKDAFNAGQPADDPANFSTIVQASIESLNGGDSETAAALTAILLPDVLTVDLNNPSGFLNGRQLADDVIDAELSLLTNGAVEGDGVDTNDLAFLDRFPYLAAPHE